VVTRRELLEAGISPDEIRHRLENGSLIREYRGVYRVGHRAPSTNARYMAAVKACGGDAVLSGRSAAFLHELIRGTPPAPEVTTRIDRDVKGVVTKRSRYVERTTRNGIPITTVPRTLVDLAAQLAEDALARACHEAGVRYRTTPAQVDAVLRTRRNVKGAATLRRILHGETPVTLSALEGRFLERVRAAGLPLPVTNRPAGGRRVDCRWPEHCLTVELDSYRYFRRYTHNDVFDEPDAMLAELRSLISPAWSSR
jgi:hypothetical protein